MNFVRQTLSITATNLRSIQLRLGNSLVIVVGIAAVVGVLIPVLAMSAGFHSTIVGDARPERAIVLSRRATAEYNSSISREDFGKVINLHEVRRDASGRPIASGEVVLQAPVSRKRNQADVSITLRGVGGQYFVMRPELKLVSGRMYVPGRQEVIVGAAALAQFTGLEIGDGIRLQDGDWIVVGTFAGGNGMRESEVISEAQTVMSAYKLNSFNNVTVALADEDLLGSFSAAVLRETRSIAVARSEAEVLESASSWVSRILRIVAYAIGAIMALGAFFGVVSASYSAVAARGSEMATYRAIGFSPVAVALAVMIETLLLAVFGAAIGVGIAYAVFDGVVVSTLGGALFDSQLVYSLSVTPAIVITVVALACALGIAGALPPAIQAARAKITDTLYET